MVFNPEAQAPRETQIPTPDPNAFPLGIKRVEQTNGQPIYKDTAMAEADREGKLKIDPALLTQDSNGNIYIDQSLFKPENALYQELPAKKPHHTRKQKLLATALVGVGIIGAGIGIKSLSSSESTPKNAPVATGEAFLDQKNFPGSNEVASNNLETMDSYDFLNSLDVSTAERVDYGVPKLKELRDKSTANLKKRGYSVDIPNESIDPDSYSEMDIANVHAVDLESIWSIKEQQGMDEALKVLASIADPRGGYYSFMAELLAKDKKPTAVAKESLGASDIFKSDTYSHGGFQLSGNGLGSIIFTTRLDVDETFQQVAAKRVNGNNPDNKTWMTVETFGLQDPRFNSDLRFLDLQ